jgi:tellurium resistance protein TerZ
MVMGVFYKRKGEWKFNAIGEPTPDEDLDDTISTVISRYL